ncbi:MAG TPA: hypothetical protein VNL77_19910 [Roseiflexaceae bacterium]|nr:hypothetical protein [Roseiflexaceae bacterium]
MRHRSPLPEPTPAPTPPPGVLALTPPTLPSAPSPTPPSQAIRNPQTRLGALFFYSARNRDRYARELADMRAAGIDIVLPVSRGDHPHAWFRYDRLIRGFFERIPRAMWATEHGRPLIVAYAAACCQDLHRAGGLWDAVKDAFRRDFGVDSPIASRGNAPGRACPP